MTKFSISNFKFSILLLVTLAMFYGWRTWTRLGDWRNETKLWQTDIATYPDSAYAHFSLGNVYTREGRGKEAIELYQRAFEINPRFAIALGSVARNYQQLGDKDKAREYYQRALQVDPNFWEARALLEELE